MRVISYNYLACIKRGASMKILKYFPILILLFIGPLPIAFSKCCTVTNLGLYKITVKTINGKKHDLSPTDCVKLKKSDFPIRANGHKCGKPGNYSLSTFLGIHCNNDGLSYNAACY